MLLSYVSLLASSKNRSRQTTFHLKFSKFQFSKGGGKLKLGGGGEVDVGYRRVRDRKAGRPAGYAK
jgi:hypothetical protein